MCTNNNNFKYAQEEAHKLSRLQLTARSRPSLQSQSFLSQSKNSPHFVAPEDSLLSSEQPAVCLYPNPDYLSPRSSKLLFWDTF
jgi:hypothetical protein